MPQTKKSVSGTSGPSQPGDPEPGDPEPPHPQEVRLGGGGRGGLEPEQGDPDIAKSPSDPKKYRFLELGNGLRVLLISDLSRANENEEGQQEESEGGEEEEDDEDEDDDEEGESSASSDEEEEESDEEEEPELMEVDEEDRTKKKSSEKQAAAALCVGVGSFSDPDDLPGLAHFLEHMVFMGSEKFPAENDFDAFLKRHGGSDNASTDCERTVFQFDVQRKFFREALDRWAQFFICPLMVQDAVDREVEAVDSEYQLARPSDSHRKEMLFGSLARPGHPMTKFCWGNAQTLKHGPREKRINTYKRLREFWRRNYSAHYMTLAVQSRESLETLEEWVREIFIQIPNNGKPQPDFSHLQQPFDTPAFHKLYRVVPVRKVHALTISWALPPQVKHYRVKPLHYISWLMGHEGTGSILSLLRKRCWALALYGGNSESGFDQNSTYSIFSISVTLTDLGYQNFFQVVHLVFQYLKMLQNLGPQQRIYEEIQKIEDNEFRYQEQTDPIEFVENICENMQLFPKPDLLTGDQLMFHYDPEVIGTALSLLTPLRANLLLLAPENEGSCPLQEKWFGTSYSCDDIPEEWERRWESDFELNPDLHLPAENRFIATDFNLKKSDCPDSEFPVRILALEQGALWYKKDNKFKIPKAYIRFHLISPIIQESPDNLVLFDLFINILAHNLAEPAYEADVAQLEYKLMAGEHGMVIRLKGFNHKLPLLLKLIVDQLADFSTEPSVFGMFAEQLKKTYFNILIKHDRLGRDVRLLILEHHRWSVVQKYRVLTQGLQVQQLMAFAAALKEELYAEGLVQGNFTSAESIEFLQYFTDKLQFRPPPAEVPVQFRVVDLPRRHHLCRVKSLNRGDPNSEVTVYYQSGLKTLREHALMELMVVSEIQNLLGRSRTLQFLRVPVWFQMLMEEPCFDFLRTKEMLGYQVYPTFRNTSGVLGFSVTVETQATKFSSELVEQKIEDFLVSFGGRLASLSEECFAAQVTALIKLKECEDAHLGEEVDRNWYEVATQQYLFDRLSREVEVLKDFSREQLVSWFLHHHGNCSRKLSVHVVGFGVEENDPPHQNLSGSAPSSYGPVSELTFLPAAAPALRSATLITDIRAFTSSLPLHPYYKILS
ncbi:nardilysin-like isoform X1 [Poecilia formosa]|uniref:nardilysin-like isoform X1 n=3 Tax=Poecilia formosa TaxID=48698 RepID=UPI0007B86673|nr:PREDICTED: nardilysin-like isoform X1 [Poecilia formosa]XP_016520236.1 PREDICTED: nardilysin-like isoform X1 [Poecilia formosa]